MSVLSLAVRKIVDFQCIGHTRGIVGTGEIINIVGPIITVTIHSINKVKSFGLEDCEDYKPGKQFKLLEINITAAH